MATPYITNPSMDGRAPGSPQKQNLYPGQPLKKHHHKSKKTHTSTKTLLLTFGTFILAMIVLIPAWNAVSLLLDTTYVYYAGSTVAIIILGACIGVIVLYFFTILLFFGVTREEVQTEQSMKIIVSLYLTLLGGTLLFCGESLSTEASDMFEEFFYNCEYGTKTKPLYNEYTELLTLRESSSCSSEPSVEDCTGYTSNYYATVLKAMETDFLCSGFCYTNTTTTSLAMRTKQKLQFPGRLGSTMSYPETLFSNGDYTASCDGMAARDGSIFVDDIAMQTYYEGIVLICIAVLISLLRLFSVCCGVRGIPGEYYPTSYGSMQGPGQGAPLPPPQVREKRRHVHDGVLV